ncbi:MAG: GGDEF domain-containing protein [Synergistaceae bacterium]|nr:GGDEF domain-containing protein [Synergistaceae bacterium]
MTANDAEITNELRFLLDYIIKNEKIKTVFQPIISLRDGSILGHEALSRITYECKIKNAEMLFHVAEKFNRLWSLDLLCRTKALEAAFEFMIPPYSKKLFINVNPNIINYETYKKGFTRSFLEQHDIASENVIFEITEKNVIMDLKGFIATINNYKNQNFKIAIDDGGAGYSGLNLISDIRPNYLKLDMKLIRNINSDRMKYALVKGMVEFSKESNVSLIAEGIETYEELDTLASLEVPYGQGYIIQRPNERILEIAPEVLQALKAINLKKNHILQNSVSSLYINNLSIHAGTVSPDEVIADVYDKFKRDQKCFGLCIVEDGCPIGIISREKMAVRLSGQYGFTLNARRPISEIMDKEFLSVDHKTPVSIVSSTAMSRPNDKTYDFIVITEEGKYSGVVTIKELLMKTTELEVSTAKNQNPLTGLPGNQTIERRLDHTLSSEDQYSVAYIDIDNFKAYNDVYGFEKGDLVIKLLADILLSALRSSAFIGHVGGDDFLVIFSSHVTESFFDEIRIDFERSVLSLYNKTDVENGYVRTYNRHGEMEEFPLLTLTAVLVNNIEHNFSDRFQLTETLASLKKRAKENKSGRPVKTEKISSVC